MGPRIKYARSGDVHIAYAVLGDGPLDLVYVPGWVSHIEGWWEMPAAAAFFERLASFSRLILLDKRGTGMSDRVSIRELPTLEQRMDDVRAVMDAAGSKRAALVGLSEGGPMAALFATTYPMRTVALIMLGSGAGNFWADSPFSRATNSREEAEARIEEDWTNGVLFPGLDVWAPSVAHLEEVQNGVARFMRLSASPAAAVAILQMLWQTDVSDILPTIRVPTLVLHRTGDLAVGISHARYVAERIPTAKLVELPGNDHFPWVGDAESLVGEIEEFLTGMRHAENAADRVLATVLFTDIVASTERAATLGDRRWRDLLDRHHALVRKELLKFRGHEVNTTGDGFLATFDGPARGIRCALSIRDEVRQLGIEIRAGLHTGECEVMRDKIEGIAVHTGARVAGCAEPGEVLVSSTVRDLVAGSGLRFTNRGVQSLRGIPGEWNLFRAEH